MGLIDTPPFQKVLDSLAARLTRLKHYVHLISEVRMPHIAWTWSPRVKMTMGIQFVHNLASDLIVTLTLCVGI